jgi:hypothetical protein
LVAGLDQAIHHASETLRLALGSVGQRQSAHVGAVEPVLELQG